MNTNRPADPNDPLWAEYWNIMPQWIRDLNDADTPERQEDFNNWKEQKVMSNSTLPYELVTDVVDALNQEGGAALREDYSGRGMYGKQCFGIVLPSTQVHKALAELIVQLYDDDTIDLADIATIARDLGAAACTDNMGLDTILYFPGWELSDE